MHLCFPEKEAADHKCETDERYVYRNEIYECYHGIFPLFDAVIKVFRNQCFEPFVTSSITCVKKD